MKRIMKGVSAIFLGLTMMAFIAGCSVEKPDTEITMYGYETLLDEPIVISNDNYELRFDTATTAFDIIDKKNPQAVWHSCAENTDSDALASNTVKKLMQSMIYLEYTAVNGEVKRFGSCEYSVDKKLYEWEVKDNSIIVRYTIGDIDRIYFIPPAMTKEVYDDVRSKVSNRIFVEGAYKRYDINKLKPTDNKEELLEKYPMLENEVLYILQGKSDRGVLEALFAEIGYGEEEYLKDAELYNIDTKNDKAAFNITVEYRLEEDGLVVEVPFNEIRSKNKYPLYTLRVLPFFGAAGTSDTGYMFVPDGSGALINFNNGKSNQTNYKSNVYGWDYAQNREYMTNDNSCELPVFGISRDYPLAEDGTGVKDGYSFLCIIEDGAPYASIEAQVSGTGSNHSYNYVSAAYSIYHREKMDISNGKSTNDIYNFQSELPDETLRQRYYFCQNNQNDGYVAMAKKYREYLIKNYPDLMKKETEALVPVAVDMIGAIEVIKQIAGVPTEKPVALTTYSEAADIVTKIAESGWKNVSIRYRGWFNGGLMNSAATTIRLVKQCGTRRNFRNMLDQIEKSGYDFYMDGEFQFVYDDKWLDGYTINRDTAKLVSREKVLLYDFSPVWYGPLKSQGSYYLAKPQVTVNMMQNFAKTLKKYDVTNYSFGSIGTSLGADYNVKNEVSRNETAKMQAAQLAEFKKADSKLMIDGGNFYASIYADVLVDAPVMSQRFSILDEEVPFYGMVFHGSKDYMGTALNLAEDYQTNLLRSLENGCGLYFVFMQESIDKLQETEYTYFYGANFDMWQSVADELYHRVSNDLAHVYNQYIEDHEVLGQGFVKTVYEDGTELILNYNSTSREYNGQTVPAKDYIVVKGGNK